MAARGYEFFLRVLLVSLTSERMFCSFYLYWWNFQVKTNFFIHFWNLLLANHLSNHDDANIFTCEREKQYLHCARWRYDFFVKGEILVFHRYLYNNKVYCLMADGRNDSQRLARDYSLETLHTYFNLSSLSHYTSILPKIFLLVLSPEFHNLVSTFCTTGHLIKELSIIERHENTA